MAELTSGNDLARYALPMDKRLLYQPHGFGIAQEGAYRL
jgi:hypothetical protein